MADLYSHTTTNEIHTAYKRPTKGASGEDREREKEKREKRGREREREREREKREAEITVASQMTVRPYDEEIDVILERRNAIQQIKDILKQNDAMPSSSPRKCIRLRKGGRREDRGPPYLNGLDYDVVHYDAGDVRNKSVFDNFEKTTAPTNNVYHLFHKRIKHRHRNGRDRE